MTYRAAVLGAVFLAGMGITIPAYSGVSNIQVVNGTCSSSSNTAEGPLGSDLTKRQSRFYCDSAAITFFDDYAGHVLIQFSQKQSQHSPFIGFAGRIEARQPGDVGTMMQVNNVYFGAEKATTVSDGWCKLFFKDQQLSGIACGMTLDETGRRTVAIVAFDVAPGQQQPTVEPKTQQPPPKMSNPAPSNPAPNAAGEVWQKVQSNGEEMYVKTSGGFPGNNDFEMDIVENLPESDIVDAPQSVEYAIMTNCKVRHYNVLTSIFFSEKNRGGYPVDEINSGEMVVRKFIPGSALEKALNVRCGIASERK